MNRPPLLTVFVVAILGTLLTALLGGCASKPVQTTIPKIVEVPVKEYIPLPAWTTARIGVPERRDGKLTSILANEDSRGTRVRYANCRFELIEKLGRKEAVDEHDCDALLLQAPETP